MKFAILNEDKQTICNDNIAEKHNASAQTGCVNDGALSVRTFGDQFIYQTLLPPSCRSTFSAMVLGDPTMNGDS
ncbi:hypothetical protein Aduo_004434 [Ancylostoma duodenale]